MKKKLKLCDLLILFAALLLASACFYSQLHAVYVKDDYYREKEESAILMQKCIEAIAKYKTENNIAFSPLDIHKTGIIGEDYSPITTTLGSIEAKRASASPDMAALAVTLLVQSGVKKGDTVAAVFSGSFPAVNIAVLSACEILDLNCIYITSIGSSAHGANNAQLTFPDMVKILYDNGLIKSREAAVTPGGQDDVGRDMDQESLKIIIGRLEDNGSNVILIEDYKDNLKAKDKLLNGDGKISCFINAGGNITSMGKSDSAYYLGQGIILPFSAELSKNSGLIEIYSNKGIPVINFLNIKKLFTDYNLAYDPSVVPPIGESAVYYKAEFDRTLPALAVILAFLLLLLRRYIIKNHTSFTIL